MTQPPNPNQPYGQNPQQPYGQQPPPPGAYPPQGYYQQGPPPKKSHTLRNVLLILGLLFILFVGGCLALLGGVANEVDKAMDAEAENDKPREVSAGQAFTHDGYKIDAGWKVSKDLGGVTIEGLRVTAAEADPDYEGGRQAFLTFRFYKGKENLAEVDCSGKELQVGESSAMDCYSGDDFPTDYDAIKVSDSW